MGWGGGWGDHAPETARTVARAFYEGRPCKRGNCETDGETYWLEGNKIARRVDVPRRMAAVLTAPPNEQPTFRHDRDEFSFSGWPTKMTARHLSALGVNAEVIGRKNPKCYLDGKRCDPREWYTKEEIAVLPATVVEPPPVSRMRAPSDQFINLTLPLFA